MKLEDNAGVLIPIFGIMVPIVGSIALFTFLTILSRAAEQRKEREAFYRSETLRRITESAGEGAKEAMNLLREDARLMQIKRRENLKIGGLVCLSFGVAQILYMWSKHNASYLLGLAPSLVGIALLIYVFFLAAPVESASKE